MKIKDLIEELQEINGEKEIGLAHILADSGLVIIKHNLNIIERKDIHNTWAVHERNKVNNIDCDYLLR